MAFFSFDGKVQALLIAGALAASCGGDRGIEGGPDTPADDTTDTSVTDTAADLPHIDVDPLPDVLDVEVADTDADATGVCPDPSTWTVSFLEDTLGFPVSTLRATVDVPPGLVSSSSATFTAEKGTIVDARQISASEYEVDYRWDDPAPDGSDWDRIHATWTLRCEDSSGAYDRVIDVRIIVCVSPSTMWLSWETDPESCLVSDPPPSPYRPGDWMRSADIDLEAPRAMPRGVIHTDLDATAAPGGRVRLGVEVRGPAAPSATFEWKASGGLVEAKGREALWTPPLEPGMHAVVVVVRAGGALGVEVYRIVV